jgi:hypothetical protein
VIEVGDDQVPLSKAREGINQAWDSLCSWSDPIFTSETSTEELVRASLDPARLALLSGHERYQELFQEQQQILQDGRFCQAVAAIVAASKSEVSVSLSDELRHPWDKHWDPYEGHYDHPPGSGGDFQKSDLELIANPHRLVHSIMVQPQQWWCARDDTALQIPQSLLYEIPLAIHSAGAKLHKLDIDITYPCTLNLNMSTQQMSSYAELRKHLEVFTFRMEAYFENIGHVYIQRPPRDEELERFYAYIRAVTGSSEVPEVLSDKGYVRCAVSARPKDNAKGFEAEMETWLSN